MSALDPFFKFKIGDIVTHKVTHVQKKAPRDPPTAIERIPFFVISRTLEECIAGFQAHYACRQGVVDSYDTTRIHAVSSTVTSFNEVELIPYQEEEQ